MCTKRSGSTPTTSRGTVDRQSVSRRALSRANMQFRHVLRQKMTKSSRSWTYLVQPNLQAQKMMMRSRMVLLRTKTPKKLIQQERSAEKQ
ncbi:TPA: hypothetical protein N0F65_008044 [Lagenidium giganteum]|uniref:Ribosomal protein L28 n=1 Tax=Lagenidium giganteum TaxID=4803 RepID=A0AAV2YKA2_9STRA|nr:TPA: hypothetical protein N0F65_008044 [Lagenidium giganteum]